MRNKNIVKFIILTQLNINVIYVFNISHLWLWIHTISQSQNALFWTTSKILHFHTGFTRNSRSQRTLFLLGGISSNFLPYVFVELSGSKSGDESDNTTNGRSSQHQIISLYQRHCFCHPSHCHLTHYCFSMITFLSRRILSSFAFDSFFFLYLLDVSSAFCRALNSLWAYGFLLLFQGW
mgnify:CR=1 FL=1